MESTSQAMRHSVIGASIHRLSRAHVWVLAAFITPFVLTGCGPDTSTAEANAPSSTLTNPTSMKIRLIVGDDVLTATLSDSATSGDFIALLPLTLTLTDYSNTEKISDLSKKLSIEGAPSGTDPDIGDIAYYAPWGNLAIFYRDFGYSPGLVRLGRLDGNVELLKRPETLKVTLELAPE